MFIYMGSYTNILLINVRINDKYIYNIIFKQPLKYDNNFKMLANKRTHKFIILISKRDD